MSFEAYANFVAREVRSVIAECRPRRIAGGVAFTMGSRTAMLYERLGCFWCSFSTTEGRPPMAATFSERRDAHTARVCARNITGNFDAQLAVK